MHKDRHTKTYTDKYTYQQNKTQCLHTSPNNKTTGSQLTISATGSTEITALVHLDVDVDVADESERRKEGDGSKHEEEDVAGEERVAEKLGHLQRARHIGAPEVVEHRVEEDEESGRSGIKSNP